MVDTNQMKKWKSKLNRHVCNDTKQRKCHNNKVCCLCFLLLLTVEWQKIAQNARWAADEKISLVMMESFSADSSDSVSQFFGSSFQQMISDWARNF